MTDNSAYSGPNTPQDSTPIYPEQQLPTQAPEEPAPPSEPTPQFAPTPPQLVDPVLDPGLADQYERLNQTQQASPTPPNQYQDAGQDLYDSRPQPEELLLEWTAPSRPFKKRNRQYYTTIGVIVFLISMILFFAGQFLPIAVVIAVAFMAYVLAAVPPEIVTNRITTYGVRADDTLYFWDELGRYWFDDKFHQRLVHIETTRFPNQITLVLNGQDEGELNDLLGVLLLNEKPALTSYEKAAQWLQEKIPLDTEA